VYGDATRTAITVWQTARGRPATGFIGNDDAEALGKEVAAITVAGSPAAPVPPSAEVTPPNGAERIPLTQSHGVFMVPVRINDAVTIPFVVDSGAGDLSVPEDVYKTLFRTGTITESDFREPGTYRMADGSMHVAQRLILHEVRVGDHAVKDVVASVAPDKADPLLGQSFLGTLPGWAIDNTRHALVIGVGGEGERPQAAIPLPPQPQREPPMTTISPPAAPEVQLSVVEIMRRANAALYGFNVPKDYLQAMQWFRKAADQGNAEALNSIGRLYMKGEGVPQDYAQAMRWYRKAADQGFTEARDNIGYLYAHGLGVPQDCALATKWTGRVASVLCDLPRVGDCVNTAVDWIGTRLGSPVQAPVPGSGSAIKFTNGGYQVGYDTVPAIDQSRAGDPVRMCLEAIPQGCPIGDDRGRVYQVTNLRTNRSWSRADASHECSGA
jgi:clan AA aspartic protease (TIGR02281 family)